jgi:hypothetical protein
MSSRNTYKFATTPEDDYIPRVADEATNNTDFILTTERDVLNGEGTVAVLLVRKSALALGILLPELSLAGKLLGDWLVTELEADLNSISKSTAASFDEYLENEHNEWAAVTVQGSPEDLELELETIRGEIRRIKNILNGRTVRVNVESF